jgi:hypothetical protein
MGRLLCRIGVHRWTKKRNLESGETYLQCERCREEKDAVALMDYEGGGFGS